MYARDGLAAGYCRVGMKHKCVALGMDFRQFVREGVPLEEAEKHDDEQIRRTIEAARERIRRESSNG